MENNDIIDNLKIYCSYHNKDFFNNYNLYNSKFFSSLCLIDDEIFDKYMVEYNSLLREFELMLFVYEHKLKSKYIGFCHYRRHFNYIDFKSLKTNHTCCYITCTYDGSLYKNSNVLNNLDLIKYKDNVYDIHCLHHFYYDKLNEYIKIKYPKLYDKHIKLVYNTPCTINHREMYITTWTIFCRMIKFIKGYLWYVYGNKLHNIKLILKDYNKEYVGITFSKFLEDLISLSINLFDDNTSSVFYSDNIDVILKYTGNENLEKWINKQYSLGIKNVIILNESFEKLEHLNKDTDFKYKFQECLFIDKSYDEFDNENIIQEISNYSNNCVGQYYAIPKYYIIFDNEKYLDSQEIIQYKNELWNNKKITNKKIITIQ